MKSSGNRGDKLRLEPLEDRLALSLAYHDGSILHNVEVSNVYLGQQWEGSDYVRLLDNAFNYLTNSPYMDVLGQYGVGRGSFVGNDLVPADIPAGSVLDDLDIQAWLDAEINDGYLPVPGPNSVYFVFTPPDVTVTLDGYQSGFDFVGYHDSFIGSVDWPILYAVIPYPAQEGDALSWFESLTIASSHELMEIVTDPTYAGWFDDATGEEIGDYCQDATGILNGLGVQYIWSYEDGSCVLPIDTAEQDLRTAVADQFTYSDEYFAKFITEDYQQLLGRTPSWPELSYWLQLMRAGATDEEVLAGFMGSPEYFARQGGNVTAWLDGVYGDLLGRAPDAAGEAYWFDRLAFDLDLTGVALEIANSWERGTVIVSSYYDFYLGRGAGQDEINYWVNLWSAGWTNEQITASFVGSNEYFFYHYGSTADWLVGIYQDLLGRQPDDAGYDYWLAVMA